MNASQARFVELIDRAAKDFSRAESTARELLSVGLEALDEPTSEDDRRVEAQLGTLIQSLELWKRSCASIGAALVMEKQKDRIEAGKPA